MSQCEKVNINGAMYVREDIAALQRPSVDCTGKPFVIVRSYGAGVFAGYLVEQNDKDQMAVLDRCIRLWRWTGCSLSQVATDGTSGSGENKFSVETNQHKVLTVIEIIPCTEKARLAIQAVKQWKL